MTVLFRQSFGFNTNLYETNILNLTVVLAIVIKVVGDSLQTLLSQRRKMILSTLQEADQKARDAKRRLDKAQRDLEETRTYAAEIRTQATRTIERENIAIQKQLKGDLVRFRERGQQAIEIEQQRIKQSIYKKITNLALDSAESTLLKTFRIPSSKQKELNEVHTQTTFYRLKRLHNRHTFLSNIPNYLSLKYGKNSS
jgi:F-type H+-transporting ATPase subunit b